MHELAVTQSIVDLVTQVGRREGFHRVTRVVVSVGIAGAVIPDALTFCFDIVAADADVAALVRAVRDIAERFGTRTRVPAPQVPEPIRSGWTSFWWEMALLDRQPILPFTFH